MRGSLERDISSLRALGPGGGQISRIVHVSTRAAFGVFAEKSVFLQKSREWLIGPFKGREGGIYTAFSPIFGCLIFLRKNYFSSTFV